MQLAGVNGLEPTTATEPFYRRDPRLAVGRDVVAT